MDQERPIVSVVIPAYNSEATLRESLQSALDQTISDIEVVVVDDGSDDATSDIAANVDDPRVRVVQHDRNRGRSAARNTGVNAATGEFIAYLDSDDKWYPEKLERQVSCLRERSDDWVGVYCGAYYSRSGVITQILNDLVQRPSGKEGGEELISEVLMWRLEVHVGSTLLVRSDIVDQIGEWNTSLNRLEDVGYLIQILEVGKLAYVNENLIQIRDSGKQSASIISQNHQTFLEEYAEQISQTEAKGYKVRRAHHFILAKFYFSDGQFGEGLRCLWGSTCPHPRDALGLGLSVRDGLAARLTK